MRIVQLNLWFGKMLHELETFLALEAPRTDIFCFQEVSDDERGMTPQPDTSYRTDMLAQLHRILPDFTIYFVPSTVGVSFPNRLNFPPPSGSEGCAIAVKRTIPIQSKGSAAVNRGLFEPSDNLTRPRELVWVTVPFREGVLTVATVHGLANTAPKIDNPRRLAQSHRINEVLATLPEPQVLCGDFNLDPDTESRRLLAVGRQDLVADFAIPGTRTPLFPSEYLQFADYAFCSPSIVVRQYVRLPHIVSDHYALAIELE
jgi:endonuclease/exonuclease/phosphatase family metal-dependent hydrolase